MEIYTIGHSTHDLEYLTDILDKYLITAVADVRSNPYSRFTPQFNRENIAHFLKKRNIFYIFMGHELGGRPKDPQCYQNGKVSYDLLMKNVLFNKGIDQLVSSLEHNVITLMCAEKDPIACHRMMLVSRSLVDRGIRVLHILENGSTETQDEAIARLLKELKLDEPDLFRTRNEIIAEAFEIQGKRIAYAETSLINDELAKGVQR